MDEYRLDFDRRVQQLSRKHRKLAKGYVATVTEDGLVVTRPRRRGFRLPVKGIALCIAALFAFKAVLHATLGAEAYDERVALLQAGSIAEQAGAYAMTADPVTVWLSAQIAQIIP